MGHGLLVMGPDPLLPSSALLDPSGPSLWGGLPDVPPPSKYDESPSTPNGLCSMLRTPPWLVPFNEGASVKIIYGLGSYYYLSFNVLTISQRSHVCDNSLIKQTFVSLVLPKLVG